MSRVIVKNLPRDARQDELNEMFSKCGVITDMNLKYTAEGKFRRFAFIGFTRTESVEEAIKQYNKTYYNHLKIQVEMCNDLGDPNTPRPWGQHSLRKLAESKSLTDVKPDPAQNNKSTEVNKKKKQKAEKLKEFIGDLDEDPQFQEFLSVHHKTLTTGVWSDVVNAPAASPEKRIDGSSIAVNEDDSSDEEAVTLPIASKPMTDLEYLKKHMTLKGNLEKESHKEDDSGEKKLTRKENKKEKKKIKKKENKQGLRYVAKVSGVAGRKYSTVKKNIEDLFSPLTTKDVTLPKSAHKKLIGIAFVDFLSEEDLRKALLKNNTLLAGTRIQVRSADVSKPKTLGLASRPWEKKNDSQEDEEISESGKLFIRNLAYTCTEDDVESKFGEYGPISEVLVPVDRLTKRNKGFAHVTFMMLEDAVRAFTELDGTTLQGRIIHILPGKTKAVVAESSEKSSFKKKSDIDKKTLAKSSHNWNTLFLGANAVADAMAQKYSTSKSQILDTEGTESLGVRMALGETQLVTETREFLLTSGVSLDCFSQSIGPRSKCVILAKNLPAGTREDELREKFEPHGTIGRLLLPPAGISALIEFLEPSEARIAFTKLAYTKFHHLPLYLEWAPDGVFTTEYKPPETETLDKQGDKAAEQSSSDEEEGEVEAKPGCTLFVKNLNFTTTEEDLKQVFRKCGKLKHATVSKKKDLKNPGGMLSMGYGFVAYKDKSSADKAMKVLQHTRLDGHQLELKVASRETRTKVDATKRKVQKDASQKSSKILVRNVPFEASQKEIFELFKVFGELKTVRLPKKLSGTGSHRGFGFVDFLTKQDAKRAFNALCHSTHLYGRRLVLEWAEAETTVEDLRRKTAETFSGEAPHKRLKKADLLDDLGP